MTKEPSLSATYKALPDSAKGKARAGFRASVPVWIHVISDGATGNIPQSVIDKQMSVMNLAFAGFYGGAGSGFSFTLAGVTRTDNAAWYNARINSNPEREMKKTLHRGGFDTLNVYTNLAGGFLGYAYLPGLPDSHLWQDGIVLNWESMPDASPTFEGRYDLGFTLVHEAGHWFNLEHTFFGACNAKGDFVDDTPPMREPTRGCPEGKDTCLEPGLDPIHNYMDYSDDPCYNQFTTGQVGRMQDGWIFERACRSLRAASAVPATLVSPRARSSGDRAFASGAKGRTFESCRAHVSVSSAGFYMFTPMDLYDTLLFVHVLSAFFAVGALTALWGLILGTRGAAPLLDQRSAMTYGRTAGILVGVGMMGDDHLRDLAGDLPRRLPALGRLDPRLARALGDRRLGRRPGGSGVREWAGGPRRRNPVPDDQQRRRGDHPRPHDLEAGCLRCSPRSAPTRSTCPC